MYKKLVSTIARVIFVGIIVLMGFALYDLNKKMINLDYQIYEVLETTQNLIQNIRYEYQADISIASLKLQKDFLTIQNRFNQELNSTQTTLEKDTEEIRQLIEKLRSTLKVQIQEFNEKLKKKFSEEKVNIDILLRGSVFVRCKNSLGSGTVIKINRDSVYILTCYHVIENTINSSEGQEINPLIGYNLNNDIDSIEGTVIYGAKVVKYDEKKDLALLRTNFVDRNFVEIKLATEAPKIGSPVYSVGNPLSMLRTISKGILSNHLVNFYVTDNTTTFGNSGGGLFNENSELIGIPTAVPVYLNTGGFVIPESGLGYSTDLYTVTQFLEGVDLSA